MKHQVKRANLFLIELVLNLFIFALCAAVCVGLLIHARSMSVESATLTQAVYAAQSAAETWKATGAIPDGTGPDENGLLVQAREQDGRLTVTVTGDRGLAYTLEGVERLG